MTGAVTALGDTLYPVAPGAGLSDPNEYNTSGAQFLSQARSVHPFLAVFVALLVLQVTLAGGREADGSLWPDRRRVAALVLIQVVAGVVNILLSAPAWMQVLHLAIATFLWISLAWLTLRRAETPITSPL